MLELSVCVHDSITLHLIYSTRVIIYVYMARWWAFIGWRCKLFYTVDALPLNLSFFALLVCSNFSQIDLFGGAKSAFILRRDILQYFAAQSIVVTLRWLSKTVVLTAANNKQRQLCKNRCNPFVVIKRFYYSSVSKQLWKNYNFKRGGKRKNRTY